MSTHRARGLAVLLATAAAAVVWVVGEPLLGYDLVIQPPGQEAQDLGAGAVVVIALATSLLGWALLAGLERSTSRARAIWTAVALVVLAVSFVPLVDVTASGGSKVVLALTHVAVGAVLIPAFWRTARHADKGQPVTAGR